MAESRLEEWKRHSANKTQRSEAGAGNTLVSDLRSLGSIRSPEREQETAPVPKKAERNPTSTREKQPRPKLDKDREIKPRVRLRKETREEMLDRLVNPTISLHEASVILGVCPATVRRYADMGQLACDRTGGGQRRFRLRPVLELLREQAGKRKGEKALRAR